jgi:magnesium chelatase subunit I
VAQVTDVAAQQTAPPSPTTLGELRASGATFRPVKAEIRANLLARLGRGEPSLPGIVGFEDTVVPEVERALIAGHDLVLLGERGQGKTRLIRTLIGLLDEWTPVLIGSELNEHPMLPVSAWAHRHLAEHGDATPVGWLHRSDRFGEKLATPDTSVGDLIGDVDPIKVAEGRTLGDPETVHYGLVPRTNRGIFSVNELPDLAERIQVALLNVLEERDIQVRGYQLRLPLDLLVVASANPEDYTNRGRIITPLKDRFGAEVRTHYPLELNDELSLIAQEAAVLWSDTDHAAPLVPTHLLEVVGRFARAVRDAPQVDQRSGVSARFAIAAIETVAAAAVLALAGLGVLRYSKVTDAEAVVVTVAELDDVGGAGLQDRQAGVHHGGFDAASGHGADGEPVAPDGHGGPGRPGNRIRDGDDGGDGPLLRVGHGRGEVVEPLEHGHRPRAGQGHAEGKVTAVNSSVALGRRGGGAPVRRKEVPGALWRQSSTVAWLLAR